MNAGDREDIGECFAGGKLITTEGVFDCGEAEWVGHPEYPGVELKTLLAGELAAGRLRALLVRVAPGCALAVHIHENQWEMHEVLTGTGFSTLAGSTGEYTTGTLALIPAGVKHSVQAGENGLMLLAKFF